MVTKCCKISKRPNILKTGRYITCINCAYKFADAFHTFFLSTVTYDCQLVRVGKRNRPSVWRKTKVVEENGIWFLEENDYGQWMRRVLCASREILFQSRNCLRQRVIENRGFAHNLLDVFFFIILFQKNK